MPPCSKASDCILQCTTILGMWYISYENSLLTQGVYQSRNNRVLTVTVIGRKASALLSEEGFVMGSPLCVRISFSFDLGIDVIFSVLFVCMCVCVKVYNWLMCRKVSAAYKHFLFFLKMVKENTLLLSASLSNLIFGLNY